MNQRVYPILATTVCLLIAASATEADPLVWKFAPGDSLSFQVTQQAVTTLQTPGEPITTTTSQDIWIAWNVESVDDNGHAKIRQDTLRAVIKVDAPGGGGYQFDTDSDDPPVGLAALIAPLFEALAEHDFHFVLSPQGELKELETPEELLVALKNVPGMPVAGSTDEMLKQLLRPGLAPLPEGELEVGQTWSKKVEIPMPVIGKQAVETRYEYRGSRDAEGRRLEIIAPKMQIRGDEPGAARVTVDLEVIDSQGELLFDRAAGRIHSVDVSQKISLKIVAEGNETTGVVEQTTRLVPLTDESD